MSDYDRVVIVGVGLLGGSMLELYDAMFRNGGIRYVGARDERAAAHMADACARVSGKAGVVLGAQSGPGVANLVTGVTEAFLAYSPLVAIAGMTKVESNHIFLLDILGRSGYQIGKLTQRHKAVWAKS